MKALTGRVLENTPAGDMHCLKLEVPEMEPSRPGQFVQLSVGDGAHLLRRPIGIAGAHGCTITLWVRRVGAGTAQICQWKAGQTVSLHGPLGNGFSVGESEKVWLCGGGMGVAPLLYADTFYRADRCFYGFRSVREAFIPSESAHTQICSDDGSIGPKERVTEALLRAFEETPEAQRPDRILACGPDPMLRALQSLNLPVQASLEARMACGVGACLGCNVSVREEEETVYRRVCADGPVFDLAKVVWK